MRSFRATLAGCVLCYWERDALSVTVVDKVIFERRIGSWPSVAPVVDTAPNITTSTLPEARLGIPYSQRLRTEDNRTGAWAVSDGDLPDGLILVGHTIQGKPTDLGRSAFTISFSDARGRVDHQSLAITVVPGTTPADGAIQDLAFCRQHIISANDDDSSEEIQLPFGLKLGDATHTSAYVGNNGYLTFTGPESEYTPYPLSQRNAPIIAPFFADIDTRNPNSSLVTFGASPDGKQFCVNLGRRWVLRLSRGQVHLRSARHHQTGGCFR